MECEFCGLEAKRLHTHRRCCPDNPVVWAATRDALDDGAGYIVTANGYKAMQRQPVSDTTLRKRYGTWQQVAAAFGLRWRASRKRQDDIDRPLSADEQDWSQAEPEATYPLHGYKERQTETIYRLPMPGMGLRVVHEYITLR